MVNGATCALENQSAHSRGKQGTVDPASITRESMSIGDSLNLKLLADPITSPPDTT
jgi:hypothetical protein